MVKLSENCPICGREMEKGYINPGLAAVFWSKEKAKTTHNAEILAGKRLGFRGRDFEGFKAYRCSYCKIVIFPYEEKKEE